MDLEMRIDEALEAERRVGGIRPDRGCLHRIVALISEKAPTFDPRSMTLKRTALEAAAGRAGCAIGAFVIDVLPMRTGEVYPQAVRDLSGWARAGTLDAIVLLSIDDLSPDRHAAFFLAVLFVESEVRVIEAGGHRLHRAPSRAGSWDRRDKPKVGSAASAALVAR